MKPLSMTTALLATLLAGACGSPGELPSPAAATAPARAGTVAFGLVADRPGDGAAATAEYAHWDAGGAWAVPRQPIWTLEQPLLTCRVRKAVPTTDSVGYPALLVSLLPEDAARLGDLTTRAVGRRLAVLVDGKVVLAPQVVEPLTGAFELSGRFSEADVRNLLEHLRPGSEG